MPSISLECFSLAAIEVMASGKAIMASNFSGFPEMTTEGENGLLTPVKDINGIEQALVKLAQDKKLRDAMGEKGKSKALEYFTINKMLDETFGHLSSLLL